MAVRAAEAEAAARSEAVGAMAVRVALMAAGLGEEWAAAAAAVEQMEEEMVERVAMEEMAATEGWMVGMAERKAAREVVRVTRAAVGMADGTVGREAPRPPPDQWLQCTRSGHRDMTAPGGESDKACRPRGERGAG